MAEIKDNDLKVDETQSLNASVFLLDNPRAHLFKNKNLILEIEGKCR